MTFATDSVFTFEFETEHEIPIGGFLKVKLPEEMEFPAEMVESQDPQFFTSIVLASGLPPSTYD